MTSTREHLATDAEPPLMSPEALFEGAERLLERGAGIVERHERTVAELRAWLREAAVVIDNARRINAK